MTPETEEPKEQDAAGGTEASHLSRAIALGTNLAAGMAIFTFLGYWADRWQNGEGGGAWTLVGMFMGLLFGAYEVWKVILMLNKDNAKGAGRPPGERKKE